MRPEVDTVETVGAGRIIPVDSIEQSFKLSLQVVLSVGASLTYTVEKTLDDVQDSSITPTWFPVSNLTTLTANALGFESYPVKAVRLNVTIHGTGTATLTVMQAGGSSGRPFNPLLSVESDGSGIDADVNNINFTGGTVTQTTPGSVEVALGGGAGGFTGWNGILTKNAPQTIAGFMWVTISYALEYYDSGSYIDTGTNPNQIIIPAGVQFVEALATIPVTVGTGNHDFSIRILKQPVSGSNATYGSFQVKGSTSNSTFSDQYIIRGQRIPVAEGDTLEVQIIEIAGQITVQDNDYADFNSELASSFSVRKVG